MYPEKRMPAERDVCHIAASIRLPGTQDRLPCVIVDLTEVGAGLVIEELSLLPEQFYLALPLTEGHLDERFVDLRWRDGESAGVSFLRD